MRSLVLSLGRRPVTAAMAALCAAILGISAAARMQPGLLPSLASPGITVTLRYPGVEPGKIEKILTIPSERKIGEISGIRDLISVSSAGESRIHAVFAHDTEVRLKLLEASEKIREIRGSFPREVQEPVIVQYDPADRPVLIASLSSDSFDLRTLRSIADRHFKPRLERIEGISEVNVSGGFEREIQIEFDPQKLTLQRLSPEQAGRFIAESNTVSSAGRLGAGSETSVVMDFRLSSAEELRRIYLPAENSPVELGTIAGVEDTYRDQESISRTNGEQRVTLYLTKAGSANALSVSREARAILAGISYPGVASKVEYDQGQFIENAVQGAISSCVSGSLIAVLVLYVFLRRASLTLAIALTLPACMGASLFTMYLCGVELNAMTLAGLALASGMLIDNSIVVTEAMEAARTRGEAPLEGAAHTAAEIVSATLSTIIVFVPLLFTDPSVKKLYEGLALTVSISLLFSIPFSLFVLPAVSTALPTGRVSKAPAFLQILDSGRAGRFLTARSLELLKRPGRTFSLAALLLLFLPVLFVLSRREALLPSDGSSIEASIDLPTGTHLDETAKSAAEIERRIQAHPSVSDVTSKVEPGHASLSIKLKSGESPDETIAELESTLQDPRAFVHFTKASDESASEIDIEFYGEDQEELKAAARAAADTTGRLPGVERVLLRFREQKRDLFVKLDPLRISSNVSAAGSTLRTLFSGAVVTRVFDGEREIDVRTRARGLNAPADALSLVLPDGSALQSLAQISEAESDAKLWRRNKQRTVQITAQVSGSPEDAAAQIASHIKLPHGVTYSFGESFKRQIASQNQMILSIGLSVVLIYVLLGFLFESFVLPLFVIAPVPLSWAGVLCLSAVFRFPLNMSVYLGMILLGGLVVNHSILVLTTVREKSTSIRASLRAGVSRLRPVAMTAVTTIAGILPMIVSTGDGSELWRPLALTTAAGLLIALYTSTVFVPFLSVLYDLRRKHYERPA